MPARPYDVTRLEGFSDTVFGFALTLLVVTLETPRNSGELVDLVRGSVPFALMFAMVCFIWWEHNKFFRRYGLQDAWTAFLNSVLLFVVLFYIYPLKFLTTSVLGPIFGVSDSPEMQGSRFVTLVFSIGIVLIFGTFVLLYRHAWAKRVGLQLSPADEVSLHFGRRAHLLTMSLGLTSIALALAIPDGPWISVAGLLYALMGPLHGWNGYLHSRALTDLEDLEPTA